MSQLVGKILSFIYYLHQPVYKQPAWCIAKSIIRLSAEKFIKSILHMLGLPTLMPLFHSATLGAVTPPTPSCADFSLRLANQQASNSSDGRLTIEGHIEICINGSYHAICDEGWDDRDAQVSCNILTNTTGTYSEFQYITVTQTL